MNGTREGRIILCYKAVVLFVCYRTRSFTFSSWSLWTATWHYYRTDEFAEMEESLDRKRAKRRGHRGVVTKYVQEIKAFPEVIDDATRRRAGVLRGLLRTKQEVLSRIDEEILDVCATEDIEGEITEADEISAKIEEALVSIHRITGEEQERSESRITRNEGSVSPKTSSHMSEEDSDSDSNPPTKVDKSTIKPKLPKLVLPKFNGDVTQFRSFWDSFKSAIDSNKDLSEVDKI